MPIENAGEVSAPKAGPADRAAVQGDVKAMLAEAKAKRQANDQAEHQPPPRAAKATEEAPAPEAEPEKPAEPEEPAAEPDAEAEGEEPEKPDTAARGLAKVARAEKQLREQRQALERDRAEAWSELTTARNQAVKQIQAAENFAKRVKTDPFGAITDAVGDVDPADLEYIARQLYLRSKGATTPEARQQAERDRREREAAHTARTAADEVAELKRTLDTERTERALEEQRREYITTVEAAISEETPLLAKAFKQNAKQTRAELREVGGFLAKRDGTSWPKPADVAKGWEQWKRHRIANEFGQEAVDKLLTPRPGTPTRPNPSADAIRRPSKTINPDLGSATQARAASGKSFDDVREETLALMRKGLIE